MSFILKMIPGFILDAQTKIIVGVVMLLGKALKDLAEHDDKSLAVKAMVVKAKAKFFPKASEDKVYACLLAGRDFVESVLALTK